MSPFLQAWVPRTTPVSLKERSRSALGALIGILATGWICRMAVGAGTSLPILVAPMGASAVLLFAVPSSPLAQPWSLIGGNLVAALVGVTAARLIPDPFLAAAVAVGLAIGLMMTARCVHPPSGAVALTAVLGGRAVTDLGYGFVLWPLGANSLLLLAVALLFNGLAGRNYPHRPLGGRADTATRDPPSAARVGFTPEDLDAVLAEYDQLLEVDRGDLEAILRDAEIRSYRRRSGQATCATIMARDVVAVAPGAPIREALDLLRAHRIKVLPVTDEGARVLGLVTQTDLLDKSAWGAARPAADVRPAGAADAAPRLGPPRQRGRHHDGAGRHREAGHAPRRPGPVDGPHGPASSARGGSRRAPRRHRGTVGPHRVAAGRSLGCATGRGGPGRSGGVSRRGRINRRGGGSRGRARNARSKGGSSCGSGLRGRPRGWTTWLVSESWGSVFVLDALRLPELLHCDKLLQCSIVMR